ncbi:hypothetical protein AHAS_Ahas02G0063500 [Arachis hypogaea]
MVVAVGTSGKEAIGEHQSPKFKDIQKPIADKLERPKVKKEATPEAIFRKASSIPSPTTTIHNHDMKRDIKGPLNHPQPVAISARSSIVGEIQNRSAHLLAIRVDNETKGEFINDLIKKAVDAAYMDIEEVLKFVDGMMGLMVDERAVLRHFKWPEKKANAMREAAVESELSIQRLIKLRNSVMRCTNRTHSNRLDVRFGDSEPGTIVFVWAWCSKSQLTNRSFFLELGVYESALRLLSPALLRRPSYCSSPGLGLCLHRASAPLLRLLGTKIRVDIETKGEFINDLIKKAVDASYMDIEEVLKFVDGLDGDERAILKRFNWPEKKADAMREAAVEYRELNLLEQEISSYKDDPDIPFGAALKKMASLLDKSELNIRRLIKLQNSVMRSYQAYTFQPLGCLIRG